MMKPTIGSAALLLMLSMAPAAGAYSKEEPRETSASLTTVEPTPGELLAGALTLLGFLGLIATNLVRWSSDLSWKERSVFAPPSQEERFRSSRSAGS
jgi:hypothetical protein